MSRLNREQMAARVARDIPEGARVIELVDGVSLDEVRQLTGLPLEMIE
jgi:acyl CoA:acetate/3-ketoacid CoA transferase beta subunit